MLEVVVLSVAAFVGTNIDDMLINTFFFSSAEDGREVRAVLWGKYVGSGLLVLLSIAASLGLGFLPARYVAFLGLIPIALGIREIFANRGGREADDTDERKAEKGGSGGLLWNVALVTIANGADNIGVYIPLFTGFSAVQYAVFCGVFAGMTALWCALGYRAAKLPFLKRIIKRYKQAIVPAIYILLGLYILCKG